MPSVVSLRSCSNKTPRMFGRFLCRCWRRRNRRLLLVWHFLLISLGIHSWFFSDPANPVSFSFSSTLFLNMKKATVHSIGNSRHPPLSSSSSTHIDYFAHTHPSLKWQKITEKIKRGEMMMMLLSPKMNSFWTRKGHWRKILKFCETCAFEVYRNRDEIWVFERRRLK